MSPVDFSSSSYFFSPVSPFLKASPPYKTFKINNDLRKKTLYFPKPLEKKLQNNAKIISATAPPQKEHQPKNKSNHKRTTKKQNNPNKNKKQVNQKRTRNKTKQPKTKKKQKQKKNNQKQKVTKTQPINATKKEQNKTKQPKTKIIQTTKKKQPRNKSTKKQNKTTKTQNNKKQNRNKGNNRIFTARLPALRRPLQPGSCSSSLEDFELRLWEFRRGERQR